MANWIQSRLRAAEDLLEAVDRTAKTVAVPRRDQQDAPRNFNGGRKPSTQESALHLPVTTGTLETQVPLTTADSTEVKPSAASLSSGIKEDAHAEPEMKKEAMPALTASTDTIPVEQRQIPFGPPSTAQIPFESSASAAMLQPVQKGSGASIWEPPTPAHHVPEVQASLAEPAITHELSTRELPPPKIPSPSGKIESEQHSLERSGQSRVDRNDSPPTNVEATSEQSGQVKLDSAAELRPKADAAAQAAAIAEAISAASAAAGPAWEGPPAPDVGEVQVASNSEREARLVRVVEQLRRRLDQLRGENEQLEEELRSADSKLTDMVGHAERLEDELARAEAARSSAEDAFTAAVESKQLAEQELGREREAMTARLAAAEAQAAKLAKENAKLQVESQASQEDMVAALRAEAAAAERRLDEERAAHAEARRGFVAREAELEAGLADSAAALTAMQRSVDDKNRRAAQAEQRALSAEQRADELARELASQQAQLSARAIESAGSKEGSSHVSAEVEALSRTVQEQAAALQEAAAQRQAAEERARRLQLEADRLSNELRDTGPASDLQRQFREVTELLYLKQTQLERLAAEKAAQQLSLELELGAAREQAERISRRVKTDSRSAGYLAEGDVVVPMEAMGEAYYRLANNNRVGGAVKAGAAILDTTTSTVVRILKQYPLGRLGAFAYAIFIHLFIWVLINRLQHRALSTDHLLAANTTRGNVHP